jgi:hypothetical protein
MAMQFHKAVRKRAKLRLAITGPAGSGKTYGALKIAKGMGGKVAVIDTERGSASLYSHLLEFDTLELDAPYTPERFIEALHAAEEAGYDVIILDSITHEWNGSGGILEQVDTIAKAQFRGNSWGAWNVLTPRHRRFVDAILQSSAHVIATMRSKTETDQVDDNGRKKVIKLGMKAEQREGAEYEFTVVLDVIHDGNLAVASKDRTGLFVDPHRISEATGKRVIEWLDSGAAPELSEKEAADHCAAIEAASDIASLKAAFTNAYERARAMNDGPRMALFKQKSDARKQALSAPAGAAA